MSIQQSGHRDRGIIYVVTGRKTLPEAFQSIARVKTVMPEIPVTLFTDQTDIENSHLDLVVPIHNPMHQFADKIQPLIDSPYQKTLYLDSDTYMAESVESLFLLLDKYDVLAVQDPWRSDYSFEEIPDCFPTINGGVLAVRKSPEVRNFLLDWQKNHFERYETKRKNDQPALRYTLFHSDVKFFSLPPEFNLRTYHPCFIGGHAHVKIIHERNCFAPRLAQLINQSKWPRIYGPISPKLMLFYYIQKTSNVLRRLAKSFFQTK